MNRFFGLCILGLLYGVCLGAVSTTPISTTRPAASAPAKPEPITTYTKILASLSKEAIPESSDKWGDARNSVAQDDLKRWAGKRITMSVKVFEPNESSGDWGCASEAAPVEYRQIKFHCTSRIEFRHGVTAKDVLSIKVGRTLAVRGTVFLIDSGNLQWGTEPTESGPAISVIMKDCVFGAALEAENKAAATQK